MKLHTFNIITFGCQMNVNESAWLERSLKSKGFKPALKGEAQVYIINTCSVREKPVQKIYSLLGHLQKISGQDKNVFVAVGGCVAQQLGESFFHRFPQVRLVYGPDATVNAPSAIIRLCEEPNLRISLLNFSEEYVNKDPLLTPESVPPTAFVDIMQGCNNFCTYCIVPFTRGPQKSRDLNSILNECNTLLDYGVKEITLLGQNVNAYAQDKKEWKINFTELLYKVAELPGLKRLRFMTSHPKDISPEVIAAFGELENLCPRLHLPLQSGSNEILTKMKRKYTVEHYLEIVAQLRKARPDIELSTDIIVGFPGESEQNFEETIYAMQQADFMESYSFCYCDRPGTQSVNFENKIHPEIAADRLAYLQAWQDKKREEHLKQKIGMSTSVLIEGPSRQPGTFKGRDPYGDIVNLPLPNAKIGSILPVTITDAKKHCLIAKEVE